EPRRRWREQQRHAEELGQRELHPEVGGETEVFERLRHLRQAQLRVGGEAHLQAEKRGDDPEADDYSFGSGHAQVRGVLHGRFHWFFPPSKINHEETKNTKIHSVFSSCSSFLRG